jgi:hypothetical protein
MSNGRVIGTNNIDATVPKYNVKIIKKSIQFSQLITIAITITLYYI